jgi:hypothetical protein
MGEALNQSSAAYRALLRGRGLFAAKVDLVQRGVEHVRRDVEFVGCVGAEPEDVGSKLLHERLSAPNTDIVRAMKHELDAKNLFGVANGVFHTG